MPLMEATVKKTLFLLLFMMAFFALCPAQTPGNGTQKGPTTVLLLRHAEKLRTPGDEDPALSSNGAKRAQDLVRMVQPAGIKAIYTSQYLRTRSTAEPLAEKLGLPIQKMDASDTPGLVKRILKDNAGDIVLVVGHSDTVPEIIEALGGGKVPEIADTEFDNLYIVTVIGPAKATVVHLKY